MISYPHFAVPNLYLDSGYEQEESHYGEMTTYTDLDGLEDCIRRILVRRPTPLDGRHLRFLRRGLALSQEALGNLVDRDAQTIARLEKSDAQLPPLMDLAVRAFYLARTEPSMAVGELVSIQNGSARVPDERIVLSYVAGAWTFRYDIPRFTVHLSTSVTEECGVVTQHMEAGFLKRRTLTILSNASPSDVQAIYANKNDSRLTVQAFQTQTYAEN